MLGDQRKTKIETGGDFGLLTENERKDKRDRVNGAAVCLHGKKNQFINIIRYGIIHIFRKL